MDNCDMFEDLLKKPLCFVYSKFHPLLMLENLNFDLIKLDNVNGGLIFNLKALIPCQNVESKLYSSKYQMQN